MAEYIDREAAIEYTRLHYCKDCNSYNGVRCGSCGFDDAILLIEDVTAADVVEVVRCKDCLHHTDDIINAEVVWCEKSGLAHLRDYYCADGKGEGE